MGKEKSFSLVVQMLSLSARNMTVNGKMTLCMETDHTNTLLVLTTPVNGTKANNKDMVQCNSPTVPDMKDNGMRT